jgi:hypothetical protein
MEKTLDASSFDLDQMLQLSALQPMMGGRWRPYSSQLTGFILGGLGYRRGLGGFFGLRFILVLMQQHPDEQNEQMHGKEVK